tara:strand:+ start:912 stop:1346 length:435 start_codon:yes stop_codon:yes gene_type:complete
MLSIPFFLSIYLIAKPCFLNANSNIFSVEGKAIIDKSNYLTNDLKDKISPLSNTEIIVITGIVKANPRSSRILLKDIHQTKASTSTNRNGEFSFQLSNGIYTFFILKEDSAYLNRFDGKGNFKSTKISTPIKDLLLKDDEQSLY